MKIIRFLALFLAIVMTVSVLGACSQKALINPVNNGEFAYVIVRGNESGSTVQNSVKDLRAAVKNNFECSVTVAKDSVAEDNAEAYEILVGDTNREATNKAKEALINNRVNNSKDFIVKVIGKKIVIYAVNDYMVEVATQWFIHNFCGSIDAFNQLHSNYEFIYSEHFSSNDNIINTVNGVDIGRFKVVLPKRISFLVGRHIELYAEYMDKFGYTIDLGEERDTEEEYEILVGDTTRKASESVKVEGDNYVIKVIGNKVVIKGGSELATYRAAEEFYNLVTETETSKKAFSWSDGFTVNGKYDANEAGTYTLNFNDEFEGSEINANHWGSYSFKNGTLGESSLGGTVYKTDWLGRAAEPHAANKNLVYQSNGTLHLGTMRINDADFEDSDISTVSSMVYRYGYSEVSIKLPQSPAHGSYWLNGSTNNTSSVIGRFGGIMNHSAMTEIDVLENFSSVHDYHANVHHWYNLYKADGISTSGNGHNSLDGDARYNGKSTNNKKYVYDTVKNGDTLADDFHIYGCYWDDECIEFSFDGRSFLRYDFSEQEMPSVSCGLLYLILSVGIGDASYGKTYNKNKDELRYEAEYDYVRVYQTDRINSQMVYAWPQEQETGTLKFIYPEHNVNGKY